MLVLSTTTSEKEWSMNNGPKIFKVEIFLEVKDSDLKIYLPMMCKLLNGPHKNSHLINFLSKMVFLPQKQLDGLFVSILNFKQ